MIYKAFTLRNESDYEPFIEYEEQEVKDLYFKMREFIAKVDEIIQQYYSSNPENK